MQVEHQATDAAEKDSVSLASQDNDSSQISFIETSKPASRAMRLENALPLAVVTGIIFAVAGAAPSQSSARSEPRAQGRRAAASTLAISPPRVASGQGWEGPGTWRESIALRPAQGGRRIARSQTGDSPDASSARHWDYYWMYWIRRWKWIYYTTKSFRSWRRWK